MALGGLLNLDMKTAMEHLASPMGQIGLGLMSRPNQRIGQAFSGAMRDMGQNQIQLQQWDANQMKLDQAKREQELMQQQFPELAGLPQHMQQAILAQKAAEAAARAKANAPVTLSPGSVFFDPTTRSPIYQAPTKDAAGMQMRFNPETGEFQFSQGGTPMDWGKKAESQIEGDTLSAISNLSRLERVGKMYQSNFLTLGGEIRHKIGKGLSYLGADVSPEEKQFVKQRTTFRNEVDQMFNAYRKEITGAAASVAELDRLKKTLMNTDMSPIEFEAAFGQFVGLSRRQLTLALQLKDQGLARAEITRLLNEDYELALDEQAAEMEREALGINQPATGGGDLSSRAAAILKARQQQQAVPSGGF